MFKLLALYMGSLMLRSIGIAAIAGICTWKVRNVAIRHAAWVAVLGAILLLPFVDYLLPPAWVPARIQQIAAEQKVTLSIVSASPSSVSQILVPVAAVPAQSNPVNWWSVTAMLYALVAFGMFMRLAMGYRKLSELRRTSTAITSSVWEEIVASRRRWRMPVLLESEAVQVPMTIGFVRPAVILPADWKAWDDWKIRAVLLHELAHVRRADWGIAVIAAAARCAYWMNPLSWYLERKLSQLAEQASDDASLTGTKSTTRYAEILLEFAATAQNGGRLMKGGIAMAQQNMKARIERVLGNPITGTGIVRIAGWALVMFMALPVIYSAAALQVTSAPAQAPIPRYVAEFGRNPVSPEPAAGPQAAPATAPATVPQPQQNSPNPAVDPRTVYKQLEVMKQQLQHSLNAKEESFQMLQKYNQAFVGPAPEPQNSSDKFATAESLKAEVARLESQLETIKVQLAIGQQIQANDKSVTDKSASVVEFLKSQTAGLESGLEALKVQSATGQQSQATPPTPRGDVLLDLPGDKDDLRAYLNQLANLRLMQNAFSVSFTGIQGRTLSIKISGQEFSFGCESCSFFAGESVVSSAASPPPGPGVLIRLSPDGNDLSVACHASSCRVLVDSGNTGQTLTRVLASGASESFKASKLLSVVIQKN